MHSISPLVRPTVCIYFRNHQRLACRSSETVTTAGLCRGFRAGTADSTVELPASFALVLAGNTHTCTQSVRRVCLCLTCSRFGVHLCTSKNESRANVPSQTSIAEEKSQGWLMETFLLAPRCVAIVARLAGSPHSTGTFEAAQAVPAAPLPQSLRREYTHGDTPPRSHRPRPYHTPLAHLFRGVRNGRC